MVPVRWAVTIDLRPAYIRKPVTYYEPSSRRNLVSASEELLGRLKPMRRGLDEERAQMDFVVHKYTSLHLQCDQSQDYLVPRRTPVRTISSLPAWTRPGQIYISIIQRKIVTPNDFASLTEPELCLPFHNVTRSPGFH
jgi:hypothetical protein